MFILAQMRSRNNDFHFMTGGIGGRGIYETNSINYLRLGSLSGKTGD